MTEESKGPELVDTMKVWQDLGKMRKLIATFILYDVFPPISDLLRGLQYRLARPSQSVSPYYEEVAVCWSWSAGEQWVPLGLSVAQVKTGEFSLELYAKGKGVYLMQLKLERPL